MKFNYRIFLLIIIFNILKISCSNIEINKKLSTTFKDTKNLENKQDLKGNVEIATESIPDSKVIPSPSSDKNKEGIFLPTEKINFFTDHPEVLKHFFRQPKYTVPSIKCFLRHTYNHNYYATKFLAFNFSHVLTFLSYADKNVTPRRYLDTVFSLFRQKLKATNFINAWAFLDFLEQLGPLIKNYFDKEKEKSEKLIEIKNVIYNFLLTQFDFLKEDPDKSLEQLSDQIYDLACPKPKLKEIDLTVDKLQTELMLFLELCLSLLIWSPEDQKEIWESVKLIAKYLEEFVLNNIISSIEDLDSLFWTLINRFCYFLRLSATELDLEFFQTVKIDIAVNKLQLWTLKEREAYTTTKLKYLQSMILEAEIKSRAYKTGLVSNII